VHVSDSDGDGDSDSDSDGDGDDVADNGSVSVHSDNGDVYTIRPFGDDPFDWANPL
jgi:hypothetical protein